MCFTYIVNCSLVGIIIAKNFHIHSRNFLFSKTFIISLVEPTSVQFPFFSLICSLKIEQVFRQVFDLQISSVYLSRYASKEKDTWIRALGKDFTVETGSGLIILDPVDVSGGYTSVKDKTNISLLSTDICIHLSLSAVSLILNLLSQASAALSLGSATPLVPCTNFDRIWVSEKGFFLITLNSVITIFLIYFCTLNFAA